MRNLFIVHFLFLNIVFSQTGLEIAKMVDRVDVPIDSQEELIMVLTNKKGKSRTNKMISKSIDNNQKQIIWFLEPKDDRGVAFLKIEYDEKDDELRMWLPNFNRIRRIAATRKGDSFMASDISYEDLTNREINDHEYKRLDDDKIMDINSFVIEVIPKPGSESSYSKHKTWIDKSNYKVIKEESYDKRSELRKVKEFSYVKIKKYFMPKRLFVRDVQKNHTTEIIFDKRIIDSGLDKDLFQEKNLKRLPRN